MNKILLLTLSVAGIGFLLFVKVASASSAAAATAATNAAEAVLADENSAKNDHGEAKSMTFVGTVISKSSSATAEGAKTQLSVMDQAGSVSVFAVTAGTVLTGKDGAATSLDWINQNDKISVEYTMGRDWGRTAKSIKKISDFSSEK